MITVVWAFLGRPFARTPWAMIVMAGLGAIPIASAASSDPPPGALVLFRGEDLAQWIGNDGFIQTFISPRSGSRYFRLIRN